MHVLVCVAAVLAALVPALAQPPRPKELPTPREMAVAREDVWGEAAIRAPGGPSYEFFRDLLPPLRYTNAAFKHYPIVLSAPLSPVKARWVSNGSGVNLRADKPPMWKEAGTPVAFFVGEKEEAFGADVERLNGLGTSTGRTCRSSGSATRTTGRCTSRRRSRGCSPMSTITGQSTSASRSERRPDG